MSEERTTCRVCGDPLGPRCKVGEVHGITMYVCKTIPPTRVYLTSKGALPQR